MVAILNLDIRAVFDQQLHGIRATTLDCLKEQRRTNMICNLNIIYRDIILSYQSFQWYLVQ